MVEAVQGTPPQQVQVELMRKAAEIVARQVQELLEQNVNPGRLLDERA